MKAVLSIIVAFIGNSLMNISQATQKIGLGLLPDKKTRGWLLWALGTLGITAATFVIFYAVTIGSVAIVGAMAGSGLASLTLFSKFVMKEEVGKRELIGVAVIFAAAVLVGAFAGESVPAEIKITALFIYLGIMTVAYTVSWLILSGKNGLGIVIGGFSGAVGGFVPLFQKVSASGPGTASSFFDPQKIAEAGPIGKMLMETFANPYALIWVLCSIAALVILQFAYKKDQAIRIIPAYAANYIIIPIIGGVICFGERLPIISWFGIVMILAGVMLITVKPGKNKLAE